MRSPGIFHWDRSREHPQHYSSDLFCPTVGTYFCPYKLLFQQSGDSTLSLRIKSRAQQDTRELFLTQN
jgi:hypothetical protein